MRAFWVVALLLMAGCVEPDERAFRGDRSLPLTAVDWSDALVVATEAAWQWQPDAVLHSIKAIEANAAINGGVTTHTLKDEGLGDGVAYIWTATFESDAEMLGLVIDLTGGGIIASKEVVWTGQRPAFPPNAALDTVLARAASMPSWQGPEYRLVETTWSSHGWRVEATNGLVANHGQPISFWTTFDTDGYSGKMIGDRQVDNTGETGTWWADRTLRIEKWHREVAFRATGGPLDGEVTVVDPSGVATKLQLGATKIVSEPIPGRWRVDGSTSNTNISWCADGDPGKGRNAACDAF